MSARLGRGLSRFNDNLTQHVRDDLPTGENGDDRELELSTNKKGKGSKSDVEYSQEEQFAFTVNNGKEGGSEKSGQGTLYKEKDDKDPLDLNYEERKLQRKMKKRKSTKEIPDFTSNSSGQKDPEDQIDADCVEIKVVEDPVEEDECGDKVQISTQYVKPPISHLKAIFMVFMVVVPSSLTIAFLAVPINGKVWMFCVFRVGVDALAHGGLAIVLLSVSTGKKCIKLSWLLPCYFVLWPLLALWGYLFEPYHVIRAYAAWFMTELILALTVSVVFLHIYDGTKRGWDASWRGCWLMITLTCQLFFSMVYGYYIADYSEPVKIVMCIAYPFAIAIFKYFQKLACRGDELLWEQAEIVSLVFAGIPYRIIFLEFGDYDTFFQVLAVEIFYKLIVYPSQYGKFFHKISLQIKKLLGKSTDEYDLDKKAKEMKDEQERLLSLKFLYHHIIDVISALGVLFVMMFIRHNSTGAGINMISDNDYDTLVNQYAISFAIEVFITIMIYVIIKYILKSNTFRPWQDGRETLEDLWPALFTASCVTYFSAFTMVDSADSVPKYFDN